MSTSLFAGVAANITEVIPKINFPRLVSFISKTIAMSHEIIASPTIPKAQL